MEGIIQNPVFLLHCVWNRWLIEPYHISSYFLIILNNVIILSDSKSYMYMSFWKNLENLKIGEEKYDYPSLLLAFDWLPFYLFRVFLLCTCVHCI
jgi:hypothetical protein